MANGGFPNDDEYSGSTWDGATVFSGARGINEGNPLGFEQFGPWSTGASRWTDWMTTARWSSITTQTTFDHIRIPIDPTAMLRAVDDATQTAAYLNMVKVAVDDVLAHGKKAIVDMHVSSVDPEYSDAQLCAAYPSGATWQKMKKVWRQVNVLLNSYGAGQVAFELYNESFSNGPNYRLLIKALVGYLRQTCGMRVTLLVSPYDGDYKDSSFVAADYGQNVGFVYHMYNPGIFTHQALEGASYDQYITNLEFPAVSGNRATAIAQAAANVNADTSLTPAQKTAFIDLCTFNLNYFYDSFQQISDWNGSASVPAIGSFFQQFGSLNPGSPGAGDGLEKWRVANGVPGARIFITEFGAHGKYETDGASKASFVNWLTLVSSYLNVQGLSRTIWNDDDRHFSVRADTTPGNPNGAFDADILTAIGANA